MISRAREAAKIVFLRVQRRVPVLNVRYLVNYVFPEKVVGRSKEVSNLRILVPSERVEIASPCQDPFVRVGKYYRKGSFIRPNIFVCDIPEAVVHVGTGLVCTRNMKAVPDFEYRLTHNHPFGKRKPDNIQRLKGTYSTINFWNSDNFGHWMFDCLPRAHSLALAEPHRPVTLLMPEHLGPVQRETLRRVLPTNFSVEYHPADAWLRLEEFLWPSMVSGRCNFCLPDQYYEAIRRPIFSQFGLGREPRQTARIFITRRCAKWRRLLNEDTISTLLGKYGFESVEMQDLSFQRQVELFHRAEMVVGAHGAGLCSLLFSGKIPVLVLYPTKTPQNHYHTLTKGLGQKHHFILHNGGEDDDFSVDIPQLERLLQSGLGLQARA